LRIIASVTGVIARICALAVLEIVAKSAAATKVFRKFDVTSESRSIEKARSGRRQSVTQRDCSMRLQTIA
jgi:hypothetical protein